MGQYNNSVEDQFLFVYTAKEGSNDLCGPIMLRLVGRGLWLSLSLIHEKELFQKMHWGFIQKFFSGQILSGKYFTRKEWLESKQTKGKIPYARLWTVRVCYVTKPPIHSLFTECSVYFIHVGWLFSKQMLGEIVSLVLSARCPYFSEERDKPSAYENVKNTPKLNTWMRPSTWSLFVCECGFTDVTVSSKLCNK